VAAPVRPVSKGVVAGLKDSVQSGKWFGRQAPKILTGKFYKESAENQESKWKGRMTGGSTGATTELDKLENKRQYEKAKEMKENNVSNSELEKKLREGHTDQKTGHFTPKDAVGAAAAAMVLIDRKAIKSADDFQKALSSLGRNTQEVGEMIDKVGGDIFENTKPEDYGAILNSPAFKADPNLKGTFEAKLKKDGEIKTRVDYEVARHRRDNPHLSEVDAKRRAHMEILDKLSADELGKQSSLIQSMGGDNPDTALREYFKERGKDSQFYTEALKKMSQKDRQVWMDTQAEAERVQQVQSNVQSGEQVSKGGVIIPGGSKTT
jgi:hypothetical protein